MVPHRHGCGSSYAGAVHLPRSPPRQWHLLVFVRRARVVAAGNSTLGAPKRRASLMKVHATLSTLLQGYFTQRLIAEMGASPHTVASYRDTFRLLFVFAREQLHKLPTMLVPQDLEAPFIGRFLTYLEKSRGNTPASRNIRL